MTPTIRENKAMDKKEIEKQIVILEEKAQKARKEEDWGRVRFFKDTIRKLRNMLK